MAARGYGQYCGVATAAELIGERWALLIVRDLLVGPRRYTDLKQGLPRIPTNILSSRLKQLQQGGVVRRAPLHGSGLVYELTPYGRAFEPVMLALARWGFHAMGVPREGDIVTPDSLTMALRTAFRSDRAEDLDVELRVGDVALRVVVHGGALRIEQRDPPAPRVGGALTAADPEAVIVAGPAIRRLIAGEISPAEAVAQELVAIVGGDARILDAFARTFHIPPISP